MKVSTGSPATLRFALVLSFLAATTLNAPLTLAQDDAADHVAIAADSNESAAQFVQRYLNAVATAKSLTQLIPFLQPRADRPTTPGGPRAFGEPSGKQTPGDKEMEIKLMAALLEMQRASTPRAVTITETQDRNGKTLLVMKATAVAPEAKMNLSAAGNSATGKMLIEKGPKGWLIDDESWHYVYDNGLTVNSGHDPDEVAGPAPATAASDSNQPVQAASPADKYTGQIMSAVGDVWTEPAPGTGHITVEYKNTPEGKFELLGITDEDGSRDAEELAQKALAKIALPPLPAALIDQPIVNIQLSWSPKFSETMKMVQLLHSSMRKQ
ncbi:MAG: hypothetical protein KGS72_17465 [Cyanobacteria bacterium REEB67]|nr:hypothetical protein [Cyanobacteria bacterium REEB67]